MSKTEHSWQHSQPEGRRFESWPGRARDRHSREGRVSLSRSGADARRLQDRAETAARRELKCAAAGSVEERRASDQVSDRRRWISLYRIMDCRETSTRQAVISGEIPVETVICWSAWSPILAATSRPRIRLRENPGNV